MEDAQDNIKFYSARLTCAKATARRILEEWNKEKDISVKVFYDENYDKTVLKKNGEKFFKMNYFSDHVKVVDISYYKKIKTGLMTIPLEKKGGK